MDITVIYAVGFQYPCWFMEGSQPPFYLSSQSHSQRMGSRIAQAQQEGRSTKTRWTVLRFRWKASTYRLRVFGCYQLLITQIQTPRMLSIEKVGPESI